MLTKPRKRGWNIPSKRDSNAQNKDQRSIVTACTNTYKGLMFSVHENTIVQYKDET